MSLTVDRQRAADAREQRWRSLETVGAHVTTIARMKREGLADSVIAERMGWTVRTLYRWMAAAQLVARKTAGIGK